MSHPFDLEAYMRRIAYDAPAQPDRSTLKALHRAHLAAIPFENLDIQMGAPINIDPESVQASLVRRRRGGYCFQQNSLFRLALSALGFAPRAHEARVRLDAGGSIRPRTHMVLVVPLDGEAWLTDVGFGASGIAEPLAIGGPPAQQDAWTYRTVPEGRLHVLQRAKGDGWEDLYAFTEDEVPHVDYVIGNWFTSTHPDSNFVRSLTAQRTVGPARHILRNLTYMVAHDGEWRTREVTRAELVPLLRDIFGLDIPDDARFRALDREPAGE